jgi:hypothetical protein
MRGFSLNGGVLETVRGRVPPDSFGKCAGLHETSKTGHVNVAMVAAACLGYVVLKVTLTQVLVRFWLKCYPFWLKCSILAQVFHFWLVCSMFGSNVVVFY